MSDRPCPSVERLTDYCLGKLTVQEFDSLERHVDECHSCQDTVDKLDLGGDTFVANLREKQGAEPHRADPHASEPALQAALSKARKPPAPKPTVAKVIAQPAASSAPTFAVKRWTEGAQPLTVDDFLCCVVTSQLLEVGAVRDFLKALPADQAPTDAKSAAVAFVNGGKLTAFQARALYQGKCQHLVVAEREILDLLGKGGMGNVYKARHRRLDRIEALKLISPKKLDAPEAQQRFAREARAAAKLNHPNVVTTYDAGEAGGLHFLAMEFIDGSDLARIVKERGPMSVEQAVSCTLQAAAGLQCAHAAGIVHRDIKPHNLLLDAHGKVKILDMGLARMNESRAVNQARDELTESGQIMGTIDFMSPEQTLDVHTVGPASDIYSLGCTLHYLLTGKAPYDGETFGQKMMAHHHQPIPSLCSVRTEVPSALDAIFQKMLAKRVEDRYHSMHEVLRALEQLGSAASPPAPLAPLKQEESGKLDSFLSRPGQSYDMPALAVKPSQLAPTLVAAKPSAKRNPRSALLIGLAVVAFLAAVIGGVVGYQVFTIETPTGIVEVAVAPEHADDVKVIVTRGGKKIEVGKHNDWNVTIEEGKYDVDLDPKSKAKFTLDRQSVSVAEKRKEVVRVTLRESKHPEVIGEAPKVDVWKLIKYEDELQSWPLTKQTPLKNKADWIDAKRVSTPTSPPIPVNANFTGHCPEYLLALQSTTVKYPIPRDAKSFTTVVQNTVQRFANVTVAIDSKEVFNVDSASCERIALDLPVGAKTLELRISNSHSDYIKCYLLYPRLHRSSLRTLAGDVQPNDVILASLKPETMIGEALRSTATSTDEELLLCPAVVPPGTACRDYLEDHALSNAEYEVPSGANRLRFVGYAKNNETLSFVVLIDGKRVHATPGGGIRKVDIPIPAGAKTVSLNIEAPKGNLDGRAVWCFPRFVCIEQKLESPSVEPQRPTYVHKDAVWNAATHSWYYIHPEKMTYTEAAKLAADSSAAPVVIDSKEENLFVERMAKFYEWLPDVWLGHIKGPDGKLQAANGEPITYENWHATEGKLPAEKHVYMMHGGKHADSYAWAKARACLEWQPPAVLAFDGDDYIDIPNFKYDGSHPLTFEARLADWNPGKGMSQPVFQSTYFANDAHYNTWISFIGHNVDFTKRTNEIHVGSSAKPGWILPSSTRPQSETMIDLAVVFDGEKRSIYRDGKRVQNDEFTLGDKSNPKDRGIRSRIGASLDASGTSGYGYRGVIQQVRISKSARYKAAYVPPKRLEVDADTMLLYRFDQPTGNVAKDLSPHKLDGQIIGAKWVSMDTLKSSANATTPRETAGSADGSADRRAAEFVLSRGGNVQIYADHGTNQTINKLDNLPAGKFNLLEANLRQRSFVPEELHVFAACTRLDYLDLGGTAANDESLRALAASTRFKTLALWGTSISDASLPWVGRQVGLQRLYLQNTKIKDEGVKHLEGLQKLEYLELNDTPITDECIPSLSKLIALKQVFLHRTKISPAGRAQLQKALPGCTIEPKPM